MALPNRHAVQLVSFPFISVAVCTCLRCVRTYVAELVGGASRKSSFSSTATSTSLHSSDDDVDSRHDDPHTFTLTSPKTKHGSATPPSIATSIQGECHSVAAALQGNESPLNLTKRKDAGNTTSSAGGLTNTSANSPTPQVRGIFTRLLLLRVLAIAILSVCPSVRRFVCRLWISQKR